MAIGPEKGFDGEAFYESLVSTVTARQMTWKQVSTETGVSATTLTRMAQGRRPDAASLAALGAWAGLNPAEFVTQQDSPRIAEPLAQISHLLRSDRRLNRDAAEAIDAMLRSAYERLRAQSALHGDQPTAESLGAQRPKQD